MFLWQQCFCIFEKEKEAVADFVFVFLSFRDYSGAAVRVLAKYGADLNENSNSFGRPPLELAVKKRNEAAARSLIQVGCDVNTQV